jgi:hypothetical protein
MEKYYGWFVIGTAALLGGVYAASCVLVEFRIVYHKFVPGPPAVHPVLLFAVGATLGIALTCLVAPSRFLYGTTGRAILQGLGGRTTLLFRANCLLLCFLLGTVTGIICWMVLPDLLENNGLLAR